MKKLHWSKATHALDAIRYILKDLDIRGNAHEHYEVKVNVLLRRYYDTIAGSHVW